MIVSNCGVIGSDQYQFYIQSINRITTIFTFTNTLASFLLKIQSMITAEMELKKTLQLRLIQFNVKYSQLVLCVFGVRPYIIDKKSRTIKTAWYFKIYPLIFLICIYQLMICDPPTFHGTEFESNSDAVNLLVIML